MPRRNLTCIRWLLTVFAAGIGLRGQEAKVIEKEGRVVITHSGGRPLPAQVGAALAARDRLGTGAASRAVLKMGAKWLARIDEETDIEITPAAFTAKNQDALKLALGGAFIYSREEEGEVKVQTPSVTAGLRGTQLAVRVWPDGRTFLQVLEGEVDMTNEAGTVRLASGEAGEAVPGQPPRKAPAIEMRNLLQWSLYYPAVLHPPELGLTADDQRALAASLDAYRQGDLLLALDQFPAGYAADSTGAKLYRAAVWLATGQVDAARTAVAGVSPAHPGRRAVERIIAAVLATDLPDPGAPATAGEALAESYHRQSRGDLAAARNAARTATAIAPDSGFAWTRLAELEFSFGRTREALTALERGIKLGPRNAQAHALRGFLLAAQNRIPAARTAFETAVGLDGSLGNGWLGLGLTKIKQGETEAGRADLQTAATVEPTRSVLHSYHGKALDLAGRTVVAEKDLARAKELDPADPTPWLYAAIQAGQDSRYNSAIAELEQSLRLNDNRRVYRSRFLLDQDRAVRSSNLATLFHRSGMTDLAVREATRAADRDPANASAHLFLAGSLDALRDPKRISLRFETAWFNEQLLASLLAPVGGGPLSQFVSQQEYSGLLERDGWSGTTIVEWREGGYGDAQASLSTTTGRLAVGLDLAWHRDPGQRVNQDTRRQEAYLQLKYQVSPDDVAWAMVQGQDEHGGDLAQNYSDQPGNAGLRFTDSQAPGLLLLGWHRRWSPTAHTLFLGGRLGAEQSLSAPGTSQLLLRRDPSGLQPGFLRPGPTGAIEYTSPALRNATTPPVAANPDGSLRLSADFQREIAPFLGVGVVTATFGEQLDFATRRELAFGTAELQHLWQAGRHRLIIGGRAQGGNIRTHARLDLLNPANIPFYPSPATLQDVSTRFERRSVYAYDFIEATPQLTLIAGGAWDRIQRPANFRNPPVSDREVEVTRTNGKLGFTFAPRAWLTLRGLHSRALGGVTFDESVRLEPVQLAGFNQAYRSVISESLAGSVEAPVYTLTGLSVEGARPARTWWAASFQRLEEDVEREVGAFDQLVAPVFPRGIVALPSRTDEHLDYREDVTAAGINRLVGDQWAFGLSYRHTRAVLQRRFPQVPATVNAQADRSDEATLQEVKLDANWNSPRGWFAQAELAWFAQDLRAMAGGQPAASPPGDEFWQASLEAGRRIQRGRYEASVGVLNLNDAGYQLSPLTYTREPPRQRTVFVRLRLAF